MPETPSLAAEQAAAVRESLLRVIEPLKEQVGEINRSINTIDDEIKAYRERRQAEVDELRKARREALSLIRVVEPDYAKTTAPKAAKPRTGSKRVDDVANKVVEYLRRHGGNGEVFPDGITATALNREMRGVSPVSLKPALEVLVARGVLRLDHLTRGRGKAFAIVDGALDDA